MILILILTLVPTYFLFAALHELGHGIIGGFCGGKITNFNIGFRPHITIENAKYNAFTRSLMYVNGTLFPCILSVVLIFKYEPAVENATYHFLYMQFTASVISSLISWIVIPLFLSSRISQNDDIIMFMKISKIHPAIISLTALLMFLVLIFLTINTGVFRTVFTILRGG